MYKVLKEFEFFPSTGILRGSLSGRKSKQRPPRQHSLGFRPRFLIGWNIESGRWSMDGRRGMIEQFYTPLLPL